MAYADETSEQYAKRLITNKRWRDGLSLERKLELQQREIERAKRSRRQNAKPKVRMPPEQRKTNEREYARRYRAANRDKFRKMGREFYNEDVKGAEWKKEFRNKQNAKFKEKFDNDAAFREAYRIQNNKYAVKRRKSDDIKGQKARLAGIRGRAVRQGREFTITLDDVVWNKVCPVLGIELNYQNSAQLDNSPSVHRINNDNGYVPGNVIVISWRANNLIGDGKIEELEKIVNYLKGQIAT